jgi:hypothetical protein
MTERSSPDSEPVAWRYRHIGRVDWEYTDTGKPNGPSIHLFEVEPLYSSPAPAQAAGIDRATVAEAHEHLKAGIHEVKVVGGGHVHIEFHKAAHALHHALNDDTANQSAPVLSAAHNSGEGEFVVTQASAGADTASPQATSADDLDPGTIARNLRGLEARMQYRVEAILVRDLTEANAITGHGIGIGYLLAKDLAEALGEAATFIEGASAPAQAAPATELDDPRLHHYAAPPQASQSDLETARDILSELGEKYGISDQQIVARWVSRLRAAQQAVPTPLSLKDMLRTADALIGIQEDLPDEQDRDVLGRAAHYLRKYAPSQEMKEGQS